MNPSIAIQSRRKESSNTNPATAFLSRALLGTCIGTSVALHGYQAAANAAPAIRGQFQSVAVMAALISLIATGFFKVQMASIASRPHRMRIGGQKQEVNVRRRTEVLGFLVKRWMLFLGCVGLVLGALYAGLNHYKVPLSMEPVERAMAEIGRMGQDVTLLVFALVLSGVTLVLAETTLRLTSKAGLPYQASWIYLPAILSMCTTLSHLPR